MSCPECDPVLAPTNERQGEHHFAIRFGDWRCTVEVIGTIAPVTIEDCYEALIGRGPDEPTILWRFHDPARLCDCGQGIEAYRDHHPFDAIRVRHGSTAVESRA